MKNTEETRIVNQRLILRLPLIVEKKKKNEEGEMDIQHIAFVSLASIIIVPNFIAYIIL